MTYIALPETIHPFGGINVGIQFGETLARSGRRVSLLHEHSSYSYHFVGHQLSTECFTGGPSMGDKSFRARLESLIKRERTSRPTRRRGPYDQPGTAGCIAQAGVRDHSDAVFAAEHRKSPLESLEAP